MTDTPTQTCGNCRFYRAIDEDEGNCCRHPPTVLRPTIERLPDTHWPEVDPSIDWCGEWQDQE